MQQVLMTDDRRDDLPGHIADLGPGATDIRLVCRDGKVRGHQAILSWASSIFRRLLMSSLLLEDGGKRKEEATFLLPDVSTEAVTLLLSFLLTGSLDIRASKQLVEELEEAWELLSIDRITFKSVFEAGATAQKSGRFVGAVTKTKCEKKQSVKAFKTPMKPKQCPPGPPVAAQLQGNKGTKVVVAPPLAASTPLLLPKTLAIKKIPHNLLINANVSITRESGGEVVTDKADVEIIEMPNAGDEKKSSALRDKVVWKEKVDKKGVAPKTPYFARGRRNVTMVYNKTRSTVKQGLLRPKLSQRPGGVFKRNNLQEKGKNAKVKEDLMRKAAETTMVRKSLRSKPEQVVYKEEDLERSSRRNDERRAQEDTTGSRRMKPGLLIDEAKEKQIKEKMMSSQSPKLRIPIKKLMQPGKLKYPKVAAAETPASPVLTELFPVNIDTPPPVSPAHIPKKNTVSITKTSASPSVSSIPVAPGTKLPVETPTPTSRTPISISGTPTVISGTSTAISRTPMSISRTPTSTATILSLGTPSLAYTPRKNNTLTVVPKSVLKATPESNFKASPKSALKPPVVQGELKSALKIGKSTPETTPEPKSVLKTPRSALKSELKSAMKSAGPSTITTPVPTTPGPDVGKALQSAPKSQALVQSWRESLNLKAQQQSTNPTLESVAKPKGMKGKQKSVASKRSLVSMSNTSQAAATAPMTVSISKAGEGEGKSEGEVRCFICRQTQDDEGRRLTLSNIFFVRSHLSKCLYNSGKLFQSIPPGRNNTDSKGAPIDELGNKTNSWYNCQVEGCWLAQKKGQAGQVCYKVYAIHMASQHGALEMVMLEEGDEARELVELLMTNAEEKRQCSTNLKQEVAEEVTVEESVGKPLMKKEAGTTTLAALDALFPSSASNQSSQSILCPPLVSSTQILQTSAPVVGGAGSGTLTLNLPEFNSTFQIPPSISSTYTVLPAVSSTTPSVITPLASLTNAPTLKISEVLKCRFRDCGGPGGGNPREMKLHYAGRHFSKYFQTDPSTKLPPGFTRAGNRAVCSKCTESSGKPVYVQGEENAVRGHLVVKHDSLGEILLQATEMSEARQVIGDLYPELLEWTAGP